jgi:uncharacterized UPF0160 family protein
VIVTDTEIQALLTRKAKADALAPEIRKKYAEKYDQVVAELARYGLDHQLPNWDEEVNSLVLSITLWDMGQKYVTKKPYIEWMCAAMIPEVDESFQARDQRQFERCIQVARKQLGNV